MYKIDVLLELAVLLIKLHNICLFITVYCMCLLLYYVFLWTVLSLVYADTVYVCMLVNHNYGLCLTQTSRCHMCDRHVTVPLAWNGTSSFLNRKLVFEQSSHLRWSGLFLHGTLALYGWCILLWTVTCALLEMLSVDTGIHGRKMYYSETTGVCHYFVTQLCNTTT
jgi:hypothetical protein